MARKPKTPQKENLTEVSGRDLFQTPNYAVDLIVPYLRKTDGFIWEPACGDGKIVSRLQEYGFSVFASDLRESTVAGSDVHNFLDDKIPEPILNALDYVMPVVVTNPPFSLKQKFYKVCRKTNAPFALLIPADYSSWIVDAVKYDGAEKIIPNRRIDYITPNILQRIWWGETWSYLLSILPEDDGWEKKEEHMLLYQQSNPVSWGNALDKHKHLYFTSIYDAPAKLLRKYSSSYYHSMWLTWGFGLGRTETFVELTNEMKDNI